MSHHPTHDARIRSNDPFSHTVLCSCGWERTVDTATRAHFLADRHIIYS